MRPSRGSLGAVVAALALIVTVGFFVREPDWSQVPVDSLEEFEARLESLRSGLRVPGMSAAIAVADRIVWARGFGYSNLERLIVADTETIYHLASTTKPYGATVVLQLVEEGRLRLDDPVSRFGVTTPDRSAPVKVWHLLSHTSGEPPGTRYRYDGNAFGALTQVIEKTTGQPFARELTERIIRPLGLTRTAPNPGDIHGFWSLFASLTVNAQAIEQGREAFAASGIDRQPIEAALAQGYARAWGRSIWPTGLIGPMRPMPHGVTLSTTSGLVASAPDIARFSMALDDGRLLTETTRAQAWTARLALDGEPLPYGLGWFVQVVRGETIVCQGAAARQPTPGCRRRG